MWSECFKLDSNGTFKYRLFMCDPTEYGNGTYKISKNFLTLKFDSIQMLKIDKRFNDSIKTKVSIKITDIVYEKPGYLIKIKYKNDSFYTDINGMFVRNYTGGLIEIYLKEKLIINPSKDKIPPFSLLIGTNISNFNGCFRNLAYLIHFQKEVLESNVFSH
jgi:hypothetical protein